MGPVGPVGSAGPKGDPGPAGASGSSNWGDIANKPADGQVGWGEVINKPAGFADGVDDVGPGYSSALFPNEFAIAAATATLLPLSYGLTLKRTVDVRLTLVPQTSGGVMEVLGQVVRDNGDGTLTHTVRIENLSNFPVNFKVRAMTWSDGIAPAAFRQAVRARDDGVVRLGKQNSR